MAYIMVDIFKSYVEYSKVDGNYVANDYLSKYYVLIGILYIYGKSWSKVILYIYELHIANHRISVEMQHIYNI